MTMFEDMLLKVMLEDIVPKTDPEFIHQNNIQHLNM